MKLKVLSIVGTRPNFMKIAALVPKLRHTRVNHVLLHTGQHYDFSMSRLFFDELKLPKPDIQIDMPKGLSAQQQRKFLKGEIKKILVNQKPNLVVVVGDVNSTVAGAEAAKELGIKVAHVESGLRSFDRTMPEEINRIKTDKISDFLFTTEKSANENLMKEGIGKNKIFFVGNVMIDTLLMHKKKADKSKILEELQLGKKSYCILTLHRPSNVDNKKSLESIFSILAEISRDIKIVFPVHPRTLKNIRKFGLYGKIKNNSNILLTGPAGYLEFLCLMSNAKLVLTDSGGIQEETTVLGVPCITLRDNTERPVTVEEGTNLLVSTNKQKIIRTAKKVIDDRVNAKKSIPRMWDGKAAQRIVKILLENF